MCDSWGDRNDAGMRTIPVEESVGAVLAHDITEIRPGEFKGRAFRKGHVVRKEDVCHLQRLGKEKLFVLNIEEDELHEDEAAYEMAEALSGEGVEMRGRPKEGKIDLVAGTDGLLKINRDALLEINMLGDVICATLHDNTPVKKGEVVAGTRAVPLVVKKEVITRASLIANSGQKVIRVKKLKKPKAGIVITGNEVYCGKIKDAFAPVIEQKIRAFGGKVTGVYFAPDDESFIKERLRDLVEAGADLLITTGGMSVDPDDVTRFAIRQLGASEITYGSPVLPGSMFLVAYLERAQGLSYTNHGREAVAPEENAGDGVPLPGYIPILGIPACGMYHKITIFDLILPRVLAGERIDRKDLAELGHGGLCRKCDACHYPVCGFGK
jgi:molybdenum cofactor synthesis domain-containing protein